MLHCTVATHWAETRVSVSTGPLLLSLEGKEEAVHSLSLPVHKCTYEIYLHLVVMVAGPAERLTGRKLRLRPRVNNMSDNNSSSGGGSSAEDFLLPLHRCRGYNPARH